MTNYTEAQIDAQIDAMSLDELIEAVVTGGQTDILLATRKGKAIRFPEKFVRPMGRTAAGVRGITLDGEDDSVVGMVRVADPEATILVVTHNGFGKRSRLADYRITNRGGMGVISLHNLKRNGPIVGIKGVADDDEVMITTSSGMIIRLRMQQVSVIGRATAGFKMIDLREGDHVADIAKMVITEDSEEAGGAK